MLIASVARCDIERRSWRPPPRPKQCPPIVDFGQGIEVDARGRARFVCAGDTARDVNAPKLRRARLLHLDSELPDVLKVRRPPRPGRS